MNPKIRERREEDTYFIRSTWLSHLALSKWLKLAPKRVIKEKLYPLIDKLIANCNILVICADDDENQIFAYVVWESEALHFVYTKLFYRNMGFARQLLEVVGKVDCYTTYTDDRWFKTMAKKDEMAFNPWKVQ